MGKKIIIIGAGIIGVSTALNLQERGYEVTLLDRKGICGESSFGNAGIIETDEVMPINNPGLFAKIPKYLAGMSFDLAYNPLFIAQNLGFFAQFLYHALPQPNKRVQAMLKLLMDNSFAQHEKWFTIANMGERVVKKGWSFYYRHGVSNPADAQAFQQKMRQLGVECDYLNQADVRAQNPNLNDIYSHGVWFQTSGSANNPGAIGRGYAKIFTDRGGQFVCEQVNKIDQKANKILVNNQYECDKLVVAAGVWSGQIVRPLGVRVPLIAERGYHIHAKIHHDAIPHIPFRDCDGSYVMANMDIEGIGKCVRISSGVELNTIDAPPNHRQIHNAMARAHEAINIKEFAGEIWLGRRPTTPDSLPIMGALAQYPNIYLACGNQHLGFTTGPLTGKILTDIIDGNQPIFPVGELSPARYGI